MNPPTIADIRAAAGRLSGQAVRTPLLSNAILDQRVGGRVFLKCENLQRTGAFKFRGAYNALAAMDPGIRAGGVVAASSGNHAQAVAEAARLFGIPATIVMPADAPATKRDGTARRGASIIDYNRAREDRDTVVKRVLEEQGGVLVHPFNDPFVIAGQGTVGLEIAADMKATGSSRPDAVLVPCSGGGLSAGIGVAIRDAWPETEVYIVEPEGFDDYARSLAAGHPVRNASQAGSIVDALLAPSPGALGFALNRTNLSGALAVTDEEALAAVAFAFRELKLVVEPGGAVGLAALLSGKLPAHGRTIVVVLSGGNIDGAMLARALATA